MEETASAVRLNIVNTASLGTNMALRSQRLDSSNAAQNINYEAFAQLFETHKDRIYSIASRFTGNHATATDIAQDTFLKLFTRLQEFYGGPDQLGIHASFDAWLYRIVVNSCLDHHRRNRRWLPLIEDFVDALPIGRRAVANSALEDLLKEEAAGRVQKAVSTLPASLRMVVVLRYTEALSYEEIAGILGCPTGTVASRLNRAHKMLESRLNPSKGDCK